MAAQICSYCASLTENVEQEHVFPDSWYPTTSAPVDRPKVPSCGQCNRDYGRLEERLQRHWALCVDPDDPAVRGIPERVWRSLDPKAGQGPRDARIRGRLRDGLKRSVTIVPNGERGAFPGLTDRPNQWRRANSGLYTRGAPALKLGASDIETFSRKLVRGLYVHDFGICLPRDFHIQTFAVSDQGWQELLGRIAYLGLERKGVPPGFNYWTEIDPEQPLNSAWYFHFWGKIRLQAATLASDQEVAVAE